MSGKVQYADIRARQGADIKAARESAGLTVAELGRRLQALGWPLRDGSASMALARLERGKRFVKTAEIPLFEAALPGVHLSTSTGDLVSQLQVEYRRGYAAGLAAARSAIQEMETD